MKVLVIFNHPKGNKSVVNKRWIEELGKNPGEALKQSAKEYIKYLDNL